jgi:hypothetical protein
MNKSRLCGAVFLPWSLFVFGCAAPSKNIAVSRESVEPGSSVTVRGEAHALLGTPLAVGGRLPPVKLVDAITMRDVDLSEARGSVLFLSIVPSIDAKVCECGKGSAVRFLSLCRGLASDNGEGCIEGHGPFVKYSDGPLFSKMASCHPYHE